jgi:hypothetical protein
MIDGDRRMDLECFEQGVRRAFAFLEEDIGLTFESDSSSHWWTSHLTYRNELVFVRVELDNRDRAFNILAGPIVDGGVPRYPIFPERAGEPLHWFPLWAILRARGADVPTFSFAEDDRLEAELAAWAGALREHAGDVLVSGDFGELDAPVRRIKSETLTRRTAEQNALVADILRRVQEER